MGGADEDALTLFGVGNGISRYQEITQTEMGKKTDRSMILIKSSSHSKVLQA